MLTANGNLTIVDGKRVYWRGREVLGVKELKVEYEDGEVRVKLKVTEADDALYMEMVTAGIIVKKEKTK